MSIIVSITLSVDDNINTKNLIEVLAERAENVEGVNRVISTFCDEADYHEE